MATPRFLSLSKWAFLVFLAVGISFPALSARAVTISVIPPKLELFGNPGDILTEQIRVGNQDTGNVTYQTDVEDFTASGEEGGVEFIEDPKAPKTTFSLASWVTVEPSRFTVAPGQEKSITVNIKIPKNAEPGGHYATVQVAIDPGAPGAGATAVQSKLNTLLLLRVSGNLTEKLDVSSFAADDSYNQKGPISFSLRTKNGGNVHVAPSGTIVITDMFNRKVAEVPLTQANVLPGAARIVKTSWDSGNKIGHFSATLVATYGQGKSPITGTASFFIVPLWLIWIVLAVVFILIISLTQRKKFRKLLHKLTSD